MKVIRTIIVGICVVSIMGGCKGEKGDTGVAGPSGVVIYSLTATPPVVRPGESTELSVSAGDGAGSALTYAWQSSAGSLSASDTNPVTWTAPGTVGSFLVSVQVSNGKGSTVTGYASILVSVSPTGAIVTSVNPMEAKVGEEIRVTGAGFGTTQGTSSVRVGGVLTTTVVSWSDTVIRVAIPAGAVTGEVTVKVGGVESSPGYLVILWTLENPVNVAISAANDNQVNPQIVSDESGGAIITWQDGRSGTNFDIYAQRINSSGMVQWTTNGVAVCTETSGQYEPQIVSDESGGAIITWQDGRSGNDIYAQRINNAGVPEWTANGVTVCAAAFTQYATQIVSDSSGGAIITWQDYRNGNYDIYAQRINNAGVTQWTANGVTVCAAAFTQTATQIVSDSSGGAIITWQDYRSGNYDIYAQRINNAGVPQWNANGVAICTAANIQYDPQLVSDGSGGAIITWYDYRSGNSDIYAQRINSAGATQWTTNGVAVCTAANFQGSPQLVSDGSGGAIITWGDLRSGIYDIYAQRINNAGATQWTDNGVAMCTAANNQYSPQLVSDGSGGAIITWYDNRSGINYDIYAQGVSASGRQ